MDICTKKIKRYYAISKAYLSKAPSAGHIRCIYANVGDDAVAKSIENIFDKNIILFDYSTRSIVHKLNLDKVNNYILGGGTLIFSDTKTEWFRTLKDVSMSRSSIVSFGTGVRDPNFFQDIDNRVIDEWLDILCRFKLISVRGPLSKAILERFGLKNIEVIGDPVISFSENKKIIPKKNKTLGVNFSLNHESYGSNENRKILYRNLIDSLLLIGWNIIFFPTCKEDIELFYDLKSHHLDNVKFTLSKSSLIFKDFILGVGSCDFFIGVKLHSIIFSCCALTPFLNLSYQPKCYDFIESYELNDSVKRIDKVDAAEVIEKLSSLESKSFLTQGLMRSKNNYFISAQNDFAKKCYNTFVE